MLQKHLNGVADYQAANPLLESLCGVGTFFASQQEFLDFRERVDGDMPENAPGETRRDYGDFQTPLPLAEAVCVSLRERGCAPDALVEPTCGTGAFVLAALRHFPSLQTVYGVEIHADYCRIAKERVLAWALMRGNAAPRRFPRIRIVQDDVFQHDFQSAAKSYKDQDVLVLGNPPWITNAELGRLRSTNTPQKRNRRLRGLDAVTGRSNFDLGESVARLMLDAFAPQRGRLAMLVKQAVARQLVHDAPTWPYALGDLRAARIDAGKWFNASVEASVFEAAFQGQKSDSIVCRVRSFEPPHAESSAFGWVGNRFVADVDGYREVAQFDSPSPYEWRQGLKHDCARVMELRRDNGAWVNGFGERTELEPDIVYGLLKSSDMAPALLARPRKHVLVTQRTLGEDTASLAERCPETYAYLCHHRARFDARKSAVYRHKPPFAMFGVGDYAFAPYKVAISGLYKHGHVALIAPDHEGRPMMLDDTCYFLAFQAVTEAAWVWALLNSPAARALLRSIIFIGDKRPYSKQRLMRIGLDRLAAATPYAEVQRIVQRLAPGVADRCSETQWRAFRQQWDATAQRSNP